MSRKAGIRLIYFSLAEGSSAAALFGAVSPYVGIAACASLFAGNGLASVGLFGVGVAMGSGARVEYGVGATGD